MTAGYQTAEFYFCEKILTQSLTNLESKNTVKGQAEIKAEMSYYGRKGTEVIERIVCILLETVGVESAGWEII